MNFNYLRKVQNHQVDATEGLVQQRWLLHNVHFLKANSKIIKMQLRLVTSKRG